MHVKELLEVTISRAVGAAALSVAFAAAVAAPALATTPTSEQPRALVRQAMPVSASGPTSVCSTNASQLVTGVTSIGKDLAAVPPNTVEMTGLIEGVLADVTTLQKSGCLPNVPSTPTPALPAACVPDVAKLLADVFGLVGDLSSMPPNVPGALKSGGGLATDVSGLVAAKCLSGVTPPAVPGLPKPTLPVPGPTLPSIPKVPGPPSTPKLPGVPGAPVKVALPLPTPSLPVPKLPVPAPSVSVPVPKLPVPAPSLPLPVPKLPVPSIPLPLPSVPSLPSLPSLPKLPGLPSLPSLPGASSLPSSPGKSPA